MFSVIYLGLTLGFGLSTSCAALCTPILVPYIVSTERYTIRVGLYSSILFSFGRLFSYLALGLLFGLITTSFKINPAIITFVTIALGFLLIIQGLSTLGLFRIRTVIGSTFFCKHIGTSRSPFYLGIFTGLRPCVPLVSALTYSLTLSGIDEAFIFMLSFWFGSSILILAIGSISSALAGVIAKKISAQRVRMIAGVALVVVGLFFIAQAAGLTIYHFD